MDTPRVEGRAGPAGQRAVTRAEIVVDLGAIRDNCRRLRDLVAPAQVLAVVKATATGTVWRRQRGRPVPPAFRGSASPPSTRAWRCARPGTTGAS
ncbi:MAG: hypothetical protein R2731_15220 [Nocardioides sp.]